MSAFAVRTLTFGDLSSYLQCCAGPALAAIHLVPTLAVADGREVAPWWPTLPLSSDVLRKHFIAPLGGVSRQNWWTALTSAILHFDEDHRASNATTLLLAGLGPYTAFGSLGWWLTLLGGCVAAVLTSKEGAERQARAVVERYSGGLLTQDGTAAKWLSRGATAMPSAGSAGASAGCFALLGADLCLTLERVAALIDELRRHPEEAMPWDVLQALGLTLPAVQRLLSVVEAERVALATGASGLSVGHAAHLTGFGWGVLCFLLHREVLRGKRLDQRLLAPWRWLARRVGWGRARGGTQAGRRLGRR